MIVWGGFDGSTPLGSGGRYNPARDSWTTMTTNGAPSRRISINSVMVWTGSEMIVWGGSDGSGPVNTGARYRPDKDVWVSMTTSGAPIRAGATGVWTGSELIVWGGRDGNKYFNDTFIYTLEEEVFRITGAVLENSDLLVSFPSVTGRSYKLWQSDTMIAGTWTDTGLPALTGSGGTLTFSLPAPAAGRLFVRVQAGP